MWTVYESCIVPSMLWNMSGHFLPFSHYQSKKDTFFKLWNLYCELLILWIVHCSCWEVNLVLYTVKPVYNGHSQKDQKLVFTTNYRLMQGEHSAILSTFIKLPFDIKIFVLSIFEWPLNTGFNVLYKLYSALFMLWFWFSTPNLITLFPVFM